MDVIESDERNIEDEIDLLIDKSPLFGKKLYVAGDSISYGARADITGDGTRKTYDYYWKNQYG